MRVVGAISQAWDDNNIYVKMSGKSALIFYSFFSASSILYTVFLLEECNGLTASCLSVWLFFSSLSKKLFPPENKVSLTLLMISNNKFSIIQFYRVLKNQGLEENQIWTNWKCIWCTVSFRLTTWASSVWVMPATCVNANACDEGNEVTL